MANYLTKNDLNKKIYGIEQYVPGNQSVKSLELRMTSGTTTGMPTITVMSTAYFVKDERFSEYFLTSMRSFVRFSGRYSSYLTTANMLLRNSCAKKILFLDRKDLKNRNLPWLLEEFSPTEMRSTPSYVYFLKERLAEAGLKRILKRIRYFIFSGEMLTRSQLNLFREIMPDTRIVPDYSLAETSFVTTGCADLQKKYPEFPFRVFHPAASRHLSIFEKDEKGMGEIVISAPEYKNYRTGDLGKIIEEKCRCGAEKTLMIFGRKDYDIVPALGAVFIKEAVVSVFRPLEKYAAEYLIEISEKKYGGKIKGLVSVKILPTEKFSKEGGSGALIMEALLNNLFVTPTKTLGMLVEEGIFYPPTIGVTREKLWKLKQVVLVKKDRDDV